MFIRSGFGEWRQFRLASIASVERGDCIVMSKTKTKRLNDLFSEWKRGRKRKPIVDVCVLMVSSAKSKFEKTDPKLLVRHERT